MKFSLYFYPELIIFTYLFIPDCYAYNGLNKCHYPDESLWLARCLKRRKMQKFVLAGKAKTVFRILELKAKQEAVAKRDKMRDSNKRK
jgi:hypothetical protein